MGAKHSNDREHVASEMTDLKPPENLKPQQTDGPSFYDSDFGVGFSGGGIRSAALCSGVLWALLESKTDPKHEHLAKDGYLCLPRGVLPKYICCVSGGGYIGASFTHWTRIKGGVDPRTWAPEYFAHMRTRVGYYFDFSKWRYGIRDVFATGSMLTFLGVMNLCSLLPCVFLIAHTMFLSFGIYQSHIIHGAREHADIRDPSTWMVSRMGWILTLFCFFPGVSLILNLAFQAFSNSRFKAEFRTKPGMFELARRCSGCSSCLAFSFAQFHWLMVSLVMMAFFYVIFNASTSEFDLGASTTGEFTALVFRLILVITLIAHFPGLFGLVIISQFITWILDHEHVWFIFWRDSSSINDQHTFDEHYRMWILASKILLPFVGVNALNRERVLFEYSRWRLQRTFFSDQMSMCSSIKKRRIDMIYWETENPNLYPTYIAQCTVNNWRLGPSHQKALFAHLCLARDCDFYFECLPKTGPSREQIRQMLREGEAEARRFDPTLGAHKTGATTRDQYLIDALAVAKKVVNELPHKAKLVEDHERDKTAQSESLYRQLQQVGFSEDNGHTATYDVLAMSSEGYWERYEEGLCEPVRFRPVTAGEFSLGTSMGMSAAAGSFVNGDFGSIGKYNEDTQVLLGGHMGRWVATKSVNQNYRLAFFTTYCLMILPALIMFAPAIATASDRDPCYYYWEVNHPTFDRSHLLTGCHWWLDDNVWANGTRPGDYETRPISYLFNAFGGEFASMVLFLLWGFLMRLIAMCWPAAFPFVPFSRLLTILSGLSWLGQGLPPMLYISDGGHTENLGFLALLRRRLKTIVIVDGGQDPDLKDLLSSLKQAREKLGVSFRPLQSDRVRRGEICLTSNLDMELDIDVQYFAKDEENRVLVFEVAYNNPSQNIMMPRRQDYTDDGSNHYGTIYFIQPSEKLSAGLVGDKRGPELCAAPCVQPLPKSKESLGGCCCSFCHRFPIFGAIGGRFPFHSTAFQFFTSEMFDAYHSQGATAMNEAYKIYLKKPHRAPRTTRLEMLWELEDNPPLFEDPIRKLSHALPPSPEQKTELSVAQQTEQKHESKTEAQVEVLTEAQVQPEAKAGKPETIKIGVPSAEEPKPEPKNEAQADSTKEGAAEPAPQGAQGEVRADLS